jgi:hypothetical protein
MEFIIHRVNLIKNLKKIPKKYGCEIDIRTEGSKLILNHDPFSKGDNLIDYLDEYNNGTLVLNIKESGIEDLVLNEVRKRDIKSYFLLDVEFPYLYSATKKGERNISIRFSEKEPIENLFQFKDIVDWVWIDTITTLPINQKNNKYLINFKTCLVCPSRWGRPNDITDIKNTISINKLKIDYVMTELIYIKDWLK